LFGVRHEAGLYRIVVDIVDDAGKVILIAYESIPKFGVPDMR
jgi:hypothetical protein